MIGDRFAEAEGGDSNNNRCEEEASLPCPGHCSEDHPQEEGQGKESNLEVASPSSSSPPPSPSIREESPSPPSSPETGSDFKMPPVVLTRRGSTSPHSMMAQLQSTLHLEMDDQLPLKTPERRMCPSPSPENMGVGKEARKRSFQISPTEEGATDGDCVDSRKRQVSKLLTFGSSSVLSSGSGGGVKATAEKKAVRSLFGVPTKEENDRVRRSCDDQVREEYERFRSRYFIVEGETLVSLPPYDAAT